MRSSPKLDALTTCPFHNPRGEMNRLMRESASPGVKGKDARVAAEALVLGAIWPDVLDYVEKNLPGITEVRLMVSYADVADLTPIPPWKVSLGQRYAANDVEQLRLIVDGVVHTITSIVYLKLRELSSDKTLMAHILAELRSELGGHVELEAVQYNDLELLFTEGINNAVSIWWGVISLIAENAGKDAGAEQIIAAVKASMPLVVQLASLHVLGFGTLIENITTLDGRVLILKPECFSVSDRALVLNEGALNLPTDIPTTSPRTRCPALYVPGLFKSLMEWQLKIAEQFYIPARLEREAASRKPSQIEEGKSDLAGFRGKLRSLLGLK